MRKKIPLLIFLLFLAGALLLSGYRLQASFMDKKVKETINKPVPLTIEEILAYDREGKYARDRYDQKKVEAELDKMPENLTTEQVYSFLLNLVGENYKKNKEAFDSVQPNFKQELKDLELTGSEEQVENLNVEVILDASGSMGQSVPGGVKMDLAKSSIRDFLKSLPPSANVGLRVLGHKGSGEEKDKQLSCEQTELVYGLEPYNEGKFNGVLNSFAPKGWTGIAKALQEAQKDLAPKQGTGVKNMIYLVSDGIETCGGDPVAAAKALHQSNVGAVVNIIGFDVDNQAQQQLKSVADAGGGSYVTVKDAASLKKVFADRVNELRKMNEQWRNKALEDIWKDYKNYKDLNYKAYEQINTARYREFDHLIAAKDYLKRKGKIAINMSVDLNSDYISKRISLLGTYSSNKLNENSAKIEEQANWDDVRNQFNNNNNKINQLEKSGN